MNYEMSHFSNYWNYYRGYIRTSCIAALYSYTASQFLRQITEDVLEAAVKKSIINEDQEAKGTFFDLFKSRKMRLRTLTIYFNWSDSSFVISF